MAIWAFFSSRVGGRGRRVVGCGGAGGVPFVPSISDPRGGPSWNTQDNGWYRKEVSLETAQPPLNVPWRRASKPLVTNFETKIFKFRSYSYTTPQKYMRFRRLTFIWLRIPLSRSVRDLARDSKLEHTISIRLLQYNLTIVKIKAWRGKCGCWTMITPI